MANAIIRPFLLMFNSKKVAEVQDGTYTVSSGDEAQVGSEGYIGHSDGATMTKIRATCIVPVKGVSVTLIDTLLSKRYCEMGVFADGKLQSTTMRIIEAEYAWDSKTGRATGAFQWEGGSPELAG